MVEKYGLLRSRRQLSLGRLSSFHGSYEYGIKAPLQSKNDIDKIEPFKRNNGPPEQRNI